MSRGKRQKNRFVSALAAVVLAALVPAAAIAGPLTDKGTQPGLNHPIEASGDCSLCHGNFDAQLHVEPWTTWAGSMMAQAGRDPLFWAALDVANNDAPGAGDFCLRCHTPRGWLAERSEPPLGSEDGCGMLGRIDEPDNDFDGINCHLCHRMMINPSPPAGEQNVYTENGQYWIDDGDCGGQFEPCRHGPYDYLGAGESPPPHAWVYSAYHEDSLICGNCHNVTSPLETLIDGGIDTGIPFPIERTFREWESSSYSALGPGFVTCQNCHMPDAQDDPVYASSFLSNNRTGDMPLHYFVGGNAWIPDVLRQEYPNLGLSSELTATRNLALDLLQNDTATVDLAILEPATAGQPMDVEVTVTNLSGHKLPTGYGEGRRMWINVQAQDGNSQLIWESGAYDAATGVLTHDSQAKIYLVEQGIWNYNGTNECDAADALDRPMFHFVLGNCIAIDNRIPPLGFTGGNDPQIMPVNHSYPETFPGSGELVNYDVTPYAVPIPPGVVPPVTVTATLHYQTTSKDYIDFLFNEAIENSFADDCIERSAGFPGMTRAEVLKGMWEAYGRSAPVDVAADVVAAATDLDGDGFAPPADCNDGDDQIFPGAPELCDNADNDCDSQIDEGNPGGGSSCGTGQQGVCAQGTEQCISGGIQCVANNSPATEQCNGLDDDCDGQTDENNPGGGGSCSTGIPGACSDGTLQCNSGVLQCIPDSPGSAEICDGIDNDCDGGVDEGNPGGGAGCNTGQLGVCASGVQQCTGGALVCTQQNNPSPEACNGADDDCDGTVDENNPGGGASCSTGLQGVCSDGTALCSGGNLICEPDTTGSAEVCDGLDNDCDGTVDEDNPGGGTACSTGQLGVCDAGTEVCQAGAFVCEPTTAAGNEVCGNGLDDDCDGAVDEEEDCALCDPADTYSLPTQTSRLIIKLIATPARDKVVAKGAFVMPDSSASTPDTEDVTLLITDEAGEFFSATIPATNFLPKSGGKKYDYKDSTRPYEFGGLRQGKFSRKSDGKTLKYTFKAKDLDQPPFTGPGSTVTIKIGDKCYVDSGDVCTLSTSGTTVKCR